MSILNECFYINCFGEIVYTDYRLNYRSVLGASFLEIVGSRHIKGTFRSKEEEVFI